MSISIPKRTEACLKFIREGFDADKTVAWMLKQYEDEPSMIRAKHKDKLARNIITMGGTGDQKEMNIAAFDRALEQYIRDEREKAAYELREKVSKLEIELRDSQQEIYERDADLRRLYERVDTLQQDKVQLLGASSAEPA